MHQPTPWRNAKNLITLWDKLLWSYTRKSRKKREISEKVKRSKSVVGRVVKSYSDTGKIVSAFKTGRPRKTSAREDRIMQRMSLKDRFKSCPEIKRVMNSTSCVNVSRPTVSRRLQEIGLFNRTPRKKPLVCSKNKKKRLEFATIWYLNSEQTNNLCQIEL